MKINKLHILVILLLVAISILGCSGKITVDVGRSGDFSNCWTMQRCNAQNTGYIDGSLSKSPKILWRSEIKSLDPTAPIVCYEKVFIGTPIKRIFALDAETGKIDSKLWVDTPMMFPPVISKNNMFYIGFGNWNRIGTYNFLRKKILWSKNCGDAEIAPLDADSLLIFATLKGKLYALSSNSGKKLWQYDLGFPVHTAMALRNDTIWVAAGNEIFAIKISGEPIWRKKLKNNAIGAITVSGDNIIIPLSCGGIVAMKSRMGDKEWDFSSKQFDRLPIATNGKILVATQNNGEIDAVSNDDGSLIWRAKIGRTIVSAPIIVGNTIVAISYDGTVFFIEIESGDILSFVECGSPVRRSPASDGKKIFIVSQNGEIFCLQ